MGLFDGTPLERPILCERCGLDEKQCTCPPPDTPRSSQSLRVRLEKRNKGKWVTLISGFDCSDTQLQETLSQLKSQCGAGGCVEGMNIEVQGDHTQRIPPILKKLGYRVP